MASRIVDPGLWIAFGQVQVGLADLFAQLVVRFDREKLLWLFLVGAFILCDQLGFQSFLSWFNEGVVWIPACLQNILNFAHIIVALQSPAVHILCGLEHGNSSGTLFGHVVTFLLAVHIPFSEVAALVLKVSTIHGDNFGE